MFVTGLTGSTIYAQLGIWVAVNALIYKFTACLVDILAIEIVSYTKVAVLSSGTWAIGIYSWEVK